MGVTGAAAPITGETQGAPPTAALCCSPGGAVKAQFLLKPFTGGKCKCLSCKD